MVWIHSMNGMPWTPKKMRQAVAILEEGASVTFAFDGDALPRLHELDETVFRQRPDLELHVWSVANDNRLGDEQIAALASLAHVRHLKITGVKGARFEALGAMRRLEGLSISVIGKVRLDLSFLENLAALRTVKLWATLENLGALARCKRLTELGLAGTLGDLSPLAGCTRLESLRFGDGAIRSLAFLAKLPRLSQLALDCATVACKLDPIAKLAKLKGLSLTNNKNLRDVGFLGALERVETVRIDQPLVVRLPDLSKLRRLVTIELGSMKAWTNPEVLETLARVRSIELKAINPKLGPERFFFLASSKKLRSLERVDVRFIDFAKRRRAALAAHFAGIGPRADFELLT